MAEIVVWDTEVFKYDTLLGAYIVKDDGEPKLFQSWDRQEQVDFYLQHKEDFWIGWNSNDYDDHILEAIVKGKNPYLVSQEIIKKQHRRFTNFHIYSYDLLNSVLAKPSLKLTESFCGKAIETTEVDFNLDRPLTDDERLLTETYNKSDLNQTLYNFKKFYSKFELRVSMIKEFEIPIQEGLRITGTQIAERALKAKANPALKQMPVHARMFPSLQIKDQELINWYLNEEFREGKTLEKHICNTDVAIKSGGAHSQTKKYHCDKAIYADISGFYNLIMINYDLLPRTLSEWGKQQYDFMYHEQLKLKKKDPKKRAVYKTVCLSVFGAMNNEYSQFYDPWQFSLVTTGGEMLLWDLLEKLDGLVTAFNINTDGVMLEPFDWNDEQKIFDIINEWVERNNFAIKTGIITDYHARDVNCYIMREPDGEICAKGEVFKNYDTSDEAYETMSYFNCKEPAIIAKGVAGVLLDGEFPESFIEQNKEEFSWFMYNCKKGTYDYLTYDTIAMNDKSGSSYEIQSPSRVFAKKYDGTVSIVKKHKKAIKEKADKVSNLPDNVFIWNEEMLTDEAKTKLVNRIDYQYYVDRIYEKLGQFYDI